MSLGEFWRLRILNRPVKVVVVRPYRSYRFEILVTDMILTLLGTAMLITALQAQPTILYAHDVLQNGSLNRLLITVWYLTGSLMVSVIVALRYGWKVHAFPIVLMLINLAMVVVGFMYYDDAVLSIRQDIVDNI